MPLASSSPASAYQVNQAVQRGIKARFEQDAAQNAQRVGAAGHGPWLQEGSVTSEGSYQVCVMYQEKMNIAVVHKGMGEEPTDVKLWSEERSIDSWNGMIDFTVPSPMLMKSGADASFDGLCGKVSVLLREDIEGSLEQLGKTWTQNMENKGQIGADFQFMLEQLELRTVKYEGSHVEFPDPGVKLARFKESILYFEFFIKVKQRSTKLSANSEALRCCAAM